MSKKRYEVSVIASATVLIYKTFLADSEEEARKKMAKQLEDGVWNMTPENALPHVTIQETPKIGHDFELEDIEVIEDEE